MKASSQNIVEICKYLKYFASKNAISQEQLYMELDVSPDTFDGWNVTGLYLT